MRSAGRPLSGKRRPPYTAATDLAAPHANNPPDQQFAPLLGKQVVLSVGEALSHPSATELRIRTNRDALISAHRARLLAEENKKALERQCSDLQQLREDDRRRATESHANAITRPSSAARLSRSGISSNNSYAADATTASNSATIFFSRPSTASRSRQDGNSGNVRRPLSAQQRATLSGPELVLQTMQLDPNALNASRKSPLGNRRPQSSVQRQLTAASTAYHRQFYDDKGTNSSRPPNSSNASPRHTQTMPSSPIASPRPAYACAGFDARRGLMVAAHIGSQLENMTNNAELETTADMEQASSAPELLPRDLEVFKNANMQGTTGDGLYAAIESGAGRPLPGLVLLSNTLRSTDDGTPWQDFLSSIPAPQANIGRNGTPLRTIQPDGGKFPHSQVTSMLVGRSMEIVGANHHTSTPSPPLPVSRPSSTTSRPNEDEELGIKTDPHEGGDHPVGRRPASPFDNPPPRMTSRPQTAGPSRKAHTALHSLRAHGPNLTYHPPPPPRTVEESRSRLQQALEQKEERMKEISGHETKNSQQRPQSATVRPRPTSDLHTSVVNLNSTTSSDLITQGNSSVGNTSLLGGRFVARSQRVQLGRPQSAGLVRANSAASLRSAGGNMFPPGLGSGNEVRVGAGFVIFPRAA